MGKRTIGELPVFDFLIIVTLGAVVGADIADPNIKHLPTVINIIGIGILQRIVANLKISNRKVGRLLIFEPTVVIQNGKFFDKNLKKFVILLIIYFKCLGKKIYLILMKLKQQLLKQMGL